MKLLGWMHHKLRQQNREQLKNVTGNPSSGYSARTLIDEKLFHVEPTFSLAQSGEPNRKHPDLLNKMKESGIEESLEEDSHELFHGFLAIGTLGSELLDTEPPTPTFPMSFQNLSSKEIYITEKEVKLINNELEKFLDAEAREFTDDSSERSSQVSMISFRNEQLENEYSEDGGYSATCPLQKYFFGNLIELPVIAVGQNKEKITLEEPSNISCQGSENSEKKQDFPEKVHKQSHATRFMKNILKKLHSAATCCSTTSSASNEKPTKSGVIKKKLPKVLKAKLFHRKVHPEGLITEKQLITANKDEITKVPDNSDIPDAEDQKKKRSPRKGTMKKELFNSAPYSEWTKSQNTTVNRERWIKTDDDYLVLEL